MNLKTIHIKETQSTNSCLREWSDAHPGKEGIALYTDNQTSGRGQRGNSWESEPGKNLTASVLLMPGFIPADRQFILSQIVSLAIRDALSAYTEDITVKWPNDIYWKGRKICGILIENDITGETLSRSIIGIGLNVNQRQFRSDAPNPVSLCQITGIEYHIEEILAAIGENISDRYCSLKQDSCSWPAYHEEYENSLYRKSGFHLFESGNGRFRASIHHIEPSGLLVLEREENGGTESFAFKEVAYIPE